MLIRLQFKSTGKFLVLSTDNALTIEQRSTMFNAQQDFFGSLAYPFTIPLEPNRALIKNAHYISTSIALRTYQMILWVDSRPHKQLKMSFTIHDADIEANCYFDATLITSALSNTMMWQLLGAYPGVPDVESSQVDLEEIDGGLQAYMTSTTTAAPGTMPMVFFPFRDDGAYKDVYPNAVMNFEVVGYDASTNTPALRNTSGGVLPISAVPGFVFLITVSGFQDFGAGGIACTAGRYMVFTGDGTWIETENPYGFPSPLTYPNLLFPSEAVINRWEMDATGTGSFKIDPAGPHCQTQCPAFFLAFMLRRVAAWFGYTVEGRVMGEEWFNRIAIWSRVAVDGIIADCSYYMPNISVSDFLKECRTEFGLLIDFDSTRMVCTIESIMNLETTADIVDLRANQVKSFRETSLTSTWYNITQGADSDDAAFPENYAGTPMQIGDPLTADSETDVQLLSVATQMIVEIAASDRLLASPVIANWRIPHIKQAIYGSVEFSAITTVDFSAKNNFKLRFLYWAGMQPNSSGFLYPYATSDNIPVSTRGFTNVTLSLQPGATDFSPIQFYYNFLLNSKPFEMGMDMTVAQLAALRANRRILVRDPYSFSTVSCILDQNAADLSPEAKIIPSKTILYPKVLPDNKAQVIVPVVITPPPPFDNGIVYVRLVEENETEIVETHPTEANSFFKDLNVYFFADEDGTVPKSVTDLVVGYSTTETDFFSTTSSSGPFLFYVNCNGTMFTLQPAAPVAENFTDGSGWSIVWVYALLASPHFTIIP